MAVGNANGPMQSIRENGGDIIVTVVLTSRRHSNRGFRRQIAFFAREKIAYANRAAETVAGFSFIKFALRNFRTEISVTRVSGSGYFAYFSALAGARNIIRTGRPGVGYSYQNL